MASGSRRVLTSPVFNEVKTTEAAVIVVQESGRPIGYMRLLKLLYLADRAAWQQWERPITNDAPYSMQWGPVLSTTYNMILGRAVGVGAYWSEFLGLVGSHRLCLKSAMPETKRLSRAEIRLLVETVREHKSKGDWALSRFTHTLPEYEDPGASSIPIELETLLRGVGFTQPDVERIKGELHEEAELDSLLEA
jgi:hypothetical protein